MPFLAPLAPYAGPIIKTALGIGGGLIGSKLAGRKSEEEKNLLTGQQQNVATGQQIAGDLRAQASPLTALAGKSFNPVVDYWSQLLSGNRGAATQALAPELSQMSDAFRAQQGAASALMPRGGGRATMLQQLPYQQMQQQQSLMQGMRPQAAQGLLQTGSATAQAGSQLVSNAINALYGSTAAGRSLLDYHTQRRQIDRQTGASIGEAIGSGLEGFDFGSIFGGKKKGGGGLLSAADNIPTRIG